MIRQHVWLSEIICKNINDLYDCGNFIDGSESGTDNRQVKRNRELAGDVVDKAATLFMDAFNQDPWLTSFHMKHCTAPMFNEYDAELDDNGEYKLHCDNSIMSGLRSDIVILTALNIHTEYEGGDLKFDYGPHSEGERFHTCLEIRPQGSIIIFPSFLYHQVTPITSGTRYSLVVWNLGKMFK